LKQIKNLINRNIENKVVLITGAGGSIGSEISRQVAKIIQRKGYSFRFNEYALYSIKKEIEEFLPEVKDNFFCSCKRN
jgi:FlaA1/EpsC-like NDP-sugar epimerase